MSNTPGIPNGMAELMGNLETASGPLEVLVPMAKLTMGLAESGFRFSPRVAPHWETMVTAVIKNLETYLLGCRAGLEQFAVLEARDSSPSLTSFLL